MTPPRLQRWRAMAAGHYWSFAPLAEWLTRPQPLPASEPWTAAFEDPQIGRIRLTGAIHRQPPAAAHAALPQGLSHTAVVVVHGLGGDIHSHYVERAAIAAHAQGVDCLRINLRGADMAGDDLYHAGLTADLQAALASDALQRYERIVLLGYSLGGHLVLRYASEPDRFDARVAAVAAICPPVDLARSARDIDSRRRWPYRRYVMASLKRMLRAVAARRQLPIPLQQALRIGSVRQWDEQLIAPRYGFASAAAYYQQMSVGPRLHALCCPALLVLAEHDPMVLTRSVVGALDDASAALQLRIVKRAGHVGFPSDTRLAQAGPGGLENQAMAWLLQQST